MAARPGRTRTSSTRPTDGCGSAGRSSGGRTGQGATRSWRVQPTRRVASNRKRNGISCASTSTVLCRYTSPWNDPQVKIVACVKEIPDPEIAPSVFCVDEQARKVTPLSGTRFVMSPFDEQAVELALRIRDARGEVSIALLSLCTETARATIKHGLSLGADEAFMLVDPAFDDGDSYTTARALASAI